MAKPDDEGPLLVWNFPLIRTMQSRDGILGRGFGSFLDGDGVSLPDLGRPMEAPESDTEGVSSANNTEASSESPDIEDDGVLDEIEDSIDELSENGDLLYEDSEDDATIQITEDGFEPNEVEIGIGDTVTWVNQGDTTARISSVDDDFTSPILDPGDTYEEQLYSPGEVEYKDPTSGNSERGVIQVGPDVDSSDLDPELFDGEDSDEDTSSSTDDSDSNTDTDSVRSMDEAASDKENDGRGF